MIKWIGRKFALFIERRWDRKCNMCGHEYWKHPILFDDGCMVMDEPKVRCFCKKFKQ